MNCGIHYNLQDMHAFNCFGKFLSTESTVKYTLFILANISAIKATR